MMNPEQQIAYSNLTPEQQALVARFAAGQAAAAQVVGRDPSTGAYVAANGATVTPPVPATATNLSALQQAGNAGFSLPAPDAAAALQALLAGAAPAPAHTLVAAYVPPPQEKPQEKPAGFSKTPRPRRSKHDTDETYAAKMAAYAAAHAVDLPLDAAEYVRALLSASAAKHGTDTWERQPAAWSTHLASIDRHLAAYRLRQDADPESGRLAIAHVAARVLMLLALQLRGDGDDDRKASK